MATTAEDRKRIKQAIVTLARYNKSPYVTGFIKEYSKPRIPAVKYDRKQLCALIERVLLGTPWDRTEKRYAIKLEDLISYLDELQESGRQSLYLFRLPDQGRDELVARLSNMDQLKVILGGNDEIYEHGHMVWESRRPTLSHVRHEPAGAIKSQRLVIKWIQTRPYWVSENSDDAKAFGESDENQSLMTETEEVNEADAAEEASDTEETEEPESNEESDEADEDGETRRVRVTVRLEERAVTFLVIDLESGFCELRIQSPRSNAFAGREAQLALYIRLMARLFGSAPVGPMVLAPAIRRALIAREVGILFCSAILPEGGEFIGEEGEFPPVDVRKLEAGLTIGFKWRQPKGGYGRIELDGRLDEISIVRPMLPAQHALVVKQIVEWRNEGLTDRIEPQPQVANPHALQRQVRQASAPPLKKGKPTKTETRKAVSTLGSAFTIGFDAERPTVEPGIDRAIREYTRTHTFAPAAGTSRPGRRKKKSGTVERPASTADERTLEQFLTYIKEVASSERSDFKSDIKDVRREEKWIFGLYIVSAIMALVIVAAGAVLLPFVTSKFTMGSVTALLGALTGHGTLLIRSYTKSLKAKRTLIQEDQKDSHKTLVMIQMALTIPDQVKRSITMAEVANKLLDRIAPSAPPPAQPDEQEQDT